MIMCNLIEYSDNYVKKLGSLGQYYKDDLPLTDAGTVDTFPGNSVLFKFKRTGQTDNNTTQYIKIIIPSLKIFGEPYVKLWN